MPNSTDRRSTALRDEYNRVDELLRTAHANLDTTDQAEVDSVARISERQTQLKQQLDQAEFPLLRRKTALATNYNKICAGKKMLVMNVDAARANPQCPAIRNAGSLSSPSPSRPSCR